MTEQEKKDLLTIAVIMGREVAFSLHSVMSRYGLGGYIEAADTIASWAMEFFGKHPEFTGDTETIKPLTKNFRTIEDWKDQIADFAQYKLEKYEYSCLRKKKKKK